MIRPVKDAEVRTRRTMLTGILGAAWFSVMPRAKLYASDSLMQGAHVAIHFKTGSTTTSWLSFGMPDAQRIVLTGRINGQTARILLDSGVGQLVLNKAFADTLGVAVDGSLTGVGVTSQVQMDTAKGVRISFDTLTIDAPSALLADLTELASAMREPVDALIGQDAFDSLLVDIDFEHKRVAFRDSQATPMVSGGTNLTLVRGSLGRRRLPVSVKGALSIQASFDLGAEAALVLSPSYAAEKKLFTTKKTSTALRAGISGPVEVEVAVVDKLTLGPMTFHQVPVEVPPTWALDCPAVIGFPILRRLHLIVDFPHDRINVRTIEDLLNQPFAKDHSGLGARRVNDGLQIMHVGRNSPADAAGLRVGDTIIAINGEQLTTEYFQTHPSEGGKPAGTVTKLTLSDGRHVVLTLADYY